MLNRLLTTTTACDLIRGAAQSGGPLDSLKGTIMKFRVLRGFVHNAAECAAGDIVELLEHEANRYMSFGKVVPHHEENIVQNVVEDIEHRDPETPARRGRPAKDQ